MASLRVSIFVFCLRKNSARANRESPCAGCGKLPKQALTRPLAVILSPIQELPKIGRNPVYIIGLALFVIFQIPEILAKNMATVLIFRFFSGFVGGPALATGGASMGDIFPPEHLAVAIGAWGASAFRCSPCPLGRADSPSSPCP